MKSLLLYASYVSTCVFQYIRISNNIMILIDEYRYIIIKLIRHLHFPYHSVKKINVNRN